MTDRLTPVGPALRWPMPTSAQQLGLRSGFVTLHQDAVDTASRGMAPPAPVPTSAASAELLVDTKEFVPRMLADVAAATQNINIVMFSWQPDGVGRQLADLLKRKVREGVKVNVQVDQVGSLVVPGTKYGRFINEMRDAGINLVVNPRFKLTSDLSKVANPVDHRKMLIVDGRIVYTGGINLSKKFDYWHDVMVRMEGPVAAVAGAEFVSQFVRNGGTISNPTRQLLSKAATTQGRHGVRLLVNRPNEHLQASEALVHRIRTATDRIWVLTAQLSSADIVDELVKAAERGVDVRIAVPGPSKFKNGIFAVQISRMFHHDLVNAGARVFEQPQMSHAKLFLFDDTPVIGSLNLADRAVKHDHELNAEIDSPKFRQQVIDIMQRDFDRSIEVSRERVNSVEYRVRDFIRDKTGLRY